MPEHRERVPRFRMPVVFGPSASPRQKADGTMWTLEESGTMELEWATVRFRARAEQLRRLLPPGFSLRGEPIVSVLRGSFTKLYWLAGRGYGALSVNIPVTYRGADETIDGDFMTVLWEGLPDAVVTGRDELGFPKLHAELPDTAFDEKAGTLTGTASWLGHTFFDMSLTELEEGPLPGDGTVRPTLTYKYVPETSVDGQGGAAVASVTTGAPAPGTEPATAIAPLTMRTWVGKGSLAWHRATFEQLPTTHAIVNGVADIDIVEVLDASYLLATYPGLAIAGNNQRTVRPVPGETFVPFLPAAARAAV